MCHTQEKVAFREVTKIQIPADTIVVTNPPAKALLDRRRSVESLALQRAKEPSTKGEPKSAPKPVALTKVKAPETKPSTPLVIVQPS